MNCIQLFHQSMHSIYILFLLLKEYFSTSNLAFLQCISIEPALVESLKPLKILKPKSNFFNPFCFQEPMLLVYYSERQGRYIHQYHHGRKSRGTGDKSPKIWNGGRQYKLSPRFCHIGTRMSVLWPSKYAKIRFRSGLCLGPWWGAHNASPDSLVGWGGDTGPSPRIPARSMPMNITPSKLNDTKYKSTKANLYKL